MSTDREGVRVWAVVATNGSTLAYESKEQADRIAGCFPDCRVVECVEVAAPAALGATPREQRVSDERVAELCADTDSIPADKLTLECQLALDLRDARAAGAPGATDALYRVRLDAATAALEHRECGREANYFDSIENEAVRALEWADRRSVPEASAGTTPCEEREEQVAANDALRRQMDSDPLAARQPEADATLAPDLPPGYRHEELDYIHVIVDPQGLRFHAYSREQHSENGVPAGIAWAHYGRAAYRRERERAALLRECREAFEKLSHDPGLEEHHDSGHVGTCSAIPCVMLRALDAHLGSGR